MSINVKGFELSSGELIVCNMIEEGLGSIVANMPVRVEYTYDDQNRPVFKYFPYSLMSKDVNITFYKNHMATGSFEVVKELAEVYQKIRLQLMLNMNMIKDVENAVEMADNDLPTSFTR